MHFSTESISSSGGRDANQDYCDHFTCGATTCWIVADGLGGHHGSERAAKIATLEVGRSFEAHPEVTEEALRKHLEAAQTHLLRVQQQDPEYASMRTTAVCLLANDRFMLWGHIGDSRFYLFRKGRLEAQTEDHSVPQTLVDAGEITPSGIRHHPDRNRLLRVLGSSDEFRPTITSRQRIHAGDAFLLCTDGFWEYVEEEEMLADLQASGDPQEWLYRLRDKVLARTQGDFDNYSAIAIIAHKEALHPGSASARRNKRAGAFSFAQRILRRQGTAPATPRRREILKDRFLWGVAVLLLLVSVAVIAAGVFGGSKEAVPDPADANSPEATGLTSGEQAQPPVDDPAGSTVDAREPLALAPRSEDDTSMSPLPASQPPGEEAPLSEGEPGSEEAPLNEDDLLPSFSNTVGMDFVLVPAGTFEMGYKDGDKSDERHVHSVRISKPFYMSRYEVTQRQWIDIMDTEPWIGKSVEKGDSFPAVFVSWTEARKFIERLNEKEAGSGYRYRLPTEAQWEYACRAGTTGLYSFGDDPARLSEYAWYRRNARGRAQPVGGKKPNAWGIYDMHGNVSEWVQDVYASTYYETSSKDGVAVDPTGPEDDGRPQRGLRGCSFKRGSDVCRSSFRGFGLASRQLDRIGFRLVMEVR